MPLWKIYHPEGAFSAEDKQAISEQITGVYRMLPKFYVGVVFQVVAADSFYVGGQPAPDFVRIWVDHIARTFEDEAMKDRFLAAIARIFKPFVDDRGLRWEMHVDETPFSLWTIQGLRPPLPNSEAEQRWHAEDRPSRYELAGS